MVASIVHIFSLPMRVVIKTHKKISYSGRNTALNFLIDNNRS
jgi:hypothetical protein